MSNRLINSKKARSAKAPGSARRTKIVATVGPACEPPKVLKELICAGADVLRINASHTSLEGLPHWIQQIRKASAVAQKEVAILVDLQGPRIRTGKLKDGKPVLLKKGEVLSLISASEPGFSNGTLHIVASCDGFHRMVRKGDPILLDNGLIDLKVIKIEGNKVQCQVLSGGWLGENKGINLPHAPAALPSLTEKDRDVIEIAAKTGVDYLALSFVRSPDDIAAVRLCLKKFKKTIPVIAKMEKPKAVEQMDSIMEVSDGVMVARGDLGIELGVQKVPMIQKKLIESANQHSIPVITATQMLESMMEHSRPTRAEASDVANAVLDGTDAVMLSGETSIGKYPLESVRMMSEIILEAEQNTEFQFPARKILKSKDHPICAIAHAAQNAAGDLDAKAIVAFTESGETAISVSKFERNLPIFALTPSLEMVRRLSLFHGVIPRKMVYCKSTDEMLLLGEGELIKTHFFKPGDAVVVVTGAHVFEKNYMVIIHWIRKKP